MPTPSSKLNAIMSRFLLRPTMDERKVIVRDLYEYTLELEGSLDQIATVCDCEGALIAKTALGRNKE